VTAVWQAAAAAALLVAVVISDWLVHPCPLLVVTDSHHVSFSGVTLVLTVVISSHDGTSWLPAVAWSSVVWRASVVLVRSLAVVVCWQSRVAS